MSSLLAIHPLPDDFTSPCTYPSEVKHPPQTHTTPHHPFPTLYLEAPHSSIPPVPLKSQLRPIYRSASADSSMRAGDKGKNVLAQARSYKISRPMALKSWRRAPPVQNFDERSVIGRKRSIASLLTTATHNNPPNVAMSAIPGPSCTSSSTSLLPATMGPDSAEDVKEPSAPFDWEVDLDPKDTFIEKDNWRMRSNTKVHPYALEEAPYMQSYGSTPLRRSVYFIKFHAFTDIYFSIVTTTRISYCNAWSLLDHRLFTTTVNARRRPCLTWGADQDTGCSMLLACGRVR
jgi:hypothetical protein